MNKRVQESLDDIKKGLSRHNVLDDKVIENFKKILEQLKNIDKIKEYGFEQYIKIDTAAQVFDKIQRDVNDIVKNLKNVSIGDIQWQEFMEKIFRLCKVFP